MTGTMRKMSKAVLSTGVAVLAMTAVFSLPAAAYDAEPAAEPSASAAMAWSPQVKSKARHVRHVRAQPARVASLARPGCGWTACDRQFVLMIGVGF